MTNIRSLVDNIVVSNNVSAQEKIADIMAEKLQTLLDLAKIEVAQGMFNTCEDCSEETLTQEQYDGLTEEEQADFELIDEALSGNQHKIDANKNGKVDGHDFKLLRKKKGVKEEAEQVDEDTFEQGGKMKTDTKPRHVSPHFKHLKKRSYDEIRADALKNAGLTDVSKKTPAVKKEEVEYVDEDTFEQGGKMKTDTKPRHVSPHFKHLKKLSPAEFKADVLKRAGLTDVSKKTPAVKKEEVAHEAYSDPYAAKKSAEMKKAHAATMADAKKEYDAARKPKFAKNFMKMKKEDVNLQELDDTTTFSYLQKRHGMKTLTHFKPENKVSAKSEKGKTNALASIEKKREAEREISRKATKKAGMGAAADYKKGTYSGD